MGGLSNVCMPEQIIMKMVTFDNSEYKTTPPHHNCNIRRPRAGRRVAVICDSGITLNNCHQLERFVLLNNCHQSERIVLRVASHLPTATHLLERIVLF